MQSQLIKNKQMAVVDIDYVTTMLWDDGAGVEAEKHDQHGQTQILHLAICYQLRMPTTL